MSTWSGRHGQGDRPRREALLLGAGEHLAGRQHLDVLEDRLSALDTLIRLVADHVNAVAREDEAGDARLLGDVEGKGPHPLGNIGDQAGGVPFGPSFFSTSTSPSSRAVFTQRSSTSLGEENEPAGIADFAIRETLTMSGFSVSSSLISRAATRISWVSSAGFPESFDNICRVSIMAPNPKTIARPSMINDFPFMFPLCVELFRAVHVWLAYTRRPQPKPP